jgi:hypothetical protein
MRNAGLALLPSCNFSTIILCILILSTLAFAAAPDRINGPIERAQLTRLSAGIPVKAQAQYDQGPVESSLKLGYMTLLTVPSASQQKAIDELLAQQQDPGAPQYHKWLTTEQYADRFGLSPNDIQKITIWLQSQGFAIVRVARARNFIVFSGSAAQVEKTFQIEIHNFKINGQTYFSNTTSPLIPSALSGIVSGFHGLNSFRPKSQARRGDPAYTFLYNGNDYYFLAPGDIGAIYDVNTLYTDGVDGTGQSLAVMGQTGIYQTDLTNFRQNFGLSAISCTTSSDVITACNTSNFQYILVNGTADTIYDDPNGEDDLPEADLDIEWSGATAPKAQVIFVTATTGFGVWDSWYYAVDNNVAPVITMSYGAPCEAQEAYTPDGLGTINPNEGTFSADEAELRTASLEGITFVNSAGDTGAAECDYGANLAVDGYAVAYPASSQYVTGVGGTSIPAISPNEYTSTYWNSSNTDDFSAKGYIPEQPWNDAQEFGLLCTPAKSCTLNDETVTSWAEAQAAIGISAGGGGVSNCFTIDANGVCTGGFPQPSWQSGITASTINPSGFGVTSAPARYSPDVSLLASPNFPGYLICTNEAGIGGSGTGSSCDSPTTGISDMLKACLANTAPCSIYGGTSVSAPVFAGMVTLLNQYLASLPGPEVGSSGVGPINATLYALAAKNSTNHAFNPVTTAASGIYSNGAWCEEGTPTSGLASDPWPVALQCPSSGANAGFLGFDSYNADATTGYNLVTGLGSVNAYNLVHAWPGSKAPSFTLSVTATPDSTPVNTNVVWDGTLTATNGYSNTVTLTCTTGAPSTCNISPSSITPASTGTPFTVTVGSGTAGTYSFNIQGTDGTITQTQAVNLTVTTPGFTLSAAPASVAITPGGAGGTSTITVADVGGFTGSVGLAASGLPSGVTAIFNPTSTSSTSTLTLTASGSATPGPATVTVTGTSGSLTATTSVSLTVAQNFVLSTPTTPSPSTVPSGTATSSTFNVTASNGTTFVNAVTFACNGLPDATVSCGFSSIAQGARSPQQVTVTIQTTGPNTSGGVDKLRRRADNRSPWLPLSLPLAGVVMLGFAGRKKMSKRFAIVGLCVSLVAIGLLIACGGGGGSAPVTVSVSQGTPSSIFPNDTADNWPAQTATFTATVSNTSNTAVTWTASVGTIASTGNDTATYTAPTIAAGLPSSATITATSASGPSGTATETLKPATVPGSYPLTVTATEGSISNTTSTITLMVQ